MQIYIKNTKPYSRYAIKTYGDEWNIDKKEKEKRQKWKWKERWECRIMQNLVLFLICLDNAYSTKIKYVPRYCIGCLLNKYTDSVL